jgi:hypothetical protein
MKTSKGVTISDEPPQWRDRTPSSASTGRYGTPREPSRFGDVYGDDSGDDLGYDAEYEDDLDGPGAFSILEEAMEKATPGLRAQILRDIEEDETRKKEAETKRKFEQELAVQEYRAKLIHQLQESKSKTAELTEELKAAFKDSVTDEQIANFVKERQEQGVTGDEVLKLLDSLGVRAPTLPSSQPNDNDMDDTPGDRRHSIGLLKLLFGNFSKAKTTIASSRSRSQSRSRSRSGYVTPTTVSDTSYQDAPSTLHGIRIFSVVVSIDGDLRRASRINLPDQWIVSILSRQEKWHKTRAFRKTMQTYARLDLTSRKLAEEWSGEESFQQKDLVLLYATRLDKNTSRRRRVLEATLMASDPWDFFHGRVLLVYKVQTDGRGGSDVYYKGPGGWARKRGGGGGDNWGSNRVYPHEGSEDSSTAYSRPPPSEGPHDPTNFDGYGGSFEYGEDKWYDAKESMGPQNVGIIQSERKATGPREREVKYAENQKRRSASRSRSRGYEEPNDPREGYIEYGTRPLFTPAPNPYYPPGINHLPGRPTWMKAHRKHLSPETLVYYDLPWEYDRLDPDYLIIKRTIPGHETDILFEHTRRLRAQPGRRRSFEGMFRNDWATKFGPQDFSRGGVPKEAGYAPCYDIDSEAYHTRPGKPFKMNASPSLFFRH